MNSIGAIKDALIVYSKNKTLWRFTLLIVAVFSVIVQLLINFGSFFDFYGPLNFGTLFFALFFLTIIETGLIEGVDRLRLEKEFRYKDVVQAFKSSGKHLPFIYIFLIIILSVAFFFLSPLFISTGSMFISATLVDTMGINMILFSASLFLLLTPMMVRYFILRGGTYWRSIAEGVKILVKRFPDTIVLMTFFIMSILFQIFVFAILSIVLFYGVGGIEGRSSSIFFFAGQLILNPIGMLMVIPIFSFFILWWSAAHTLYFQSIQETTAHKPKWIRQ
jgi:hypothetical protein